MRKSQIKAKDVKIQDKDKPGSWRGEQAEIVWWESLLLRKLYAITNQEKGGTPNYMIWVTTFLPLQPINVPGKEDKEAERIN